MSGIVARENLSLESCWLSDGQTEVQLDVCTRVPHEGLSVIHFPQSQTYFFQKENLKRRKCGKEGKVSRRPLPGSDYG